MMVCWRLDQGQDQGGCVLPLAGPAVTCTGPSPHCLSSTPHRYHVGQVDDHAAVAGLAVISGLGQDQAAPVVQRLSDGLKRLALPAKILRYHRNVFTADRVKSHDQHDGVRHRWYLPARIQKTAWPGAVARGPSSD